MAMIVVEIKTKTQGKTTIMLMIIRVTNMSMITTIRISNRQPRRLTLLLGQPAPFF